VLCSHPKWVVPAGSINIQALGNERTIVQYKGAQAPVLIQSSPTPREVFEFRQQLKEEFQQISGVFGVSRGEPPPGIKAGVALQFLNEQENERFNELSMKWNEMIREVAIMTIAVAGDYYDASDARMVRVLGKDEIWRTKFFDSAHLSKDYDIRVQNSSALSQSKSARIQSLMDLNKEFPGAVRQEQVMDLLGLAQNDKFIDAATKSVKSAEAENEMILSDGGDSQVEEYEDHLTHWEIHGRELQAYSFKHETPKNIQEKLKDHILVHEMYLLEKSKFNQKLAEELSAIRNFPMIFTPEPLPPPSPVVAPQGQPIEGLAIPPEMPVNPEMSLDEQLLSTEQPPQSEMVPSVVTQTQGV
jgi:hypothetical protein